MLWPWRANSAAIVPTAFIVGAVFVTRVFELAETWRVLDRHYHVIIAAVLGASTLGLAATFAPRRRLNLNYAAIVLVLLVGIPAYIHVFFWISAYPFTDLFADVHPMKLAEELARTHILNNLVGASYIPVRPVLNGILISLFGYDQLIGVWALAPWAAVFKMLVAWHASRLAGEHRLLAFALLCGSLLSFELANSTLCAFGSILLMICLIDFAEAIRRPSIAAFAAISLATASLLFWRYLNTSAFGGVIAFAVISLAGLLHQRSRSALLIVLLVGCVVQLHRASLMFVPIAAVVAATWRLRTRTDFITAAATFGRIAPFAIATIPVIVLAGARLSGSDAVEAVLLAIMVRLGGTITPEVFLGLGVKNAVLEWLQSAGPLLALLAGATFIFTNMSREGRSLWKDPLFVLPWSLSSGLTLLILIGFPFAYRAMPMVCLLISVSLSASLPKLWKTVPTIAPVLLPALLGTAYAAAFLLPPMLAYSKFYQLLLIVFIAGSIGLVALRSDRALIQAAIALLAVSLALDRLSVKTLLFPHSYGKPPDGTTSITHYNRAELEFADSFKSLRPTTVIVTDPLTASIVRARTGLNVPYSYSNLDTISDEPALKLRDAIKAADDKDYARFCDVLWSMQRHAEEYRYLASRMSQASGPIDARIVVSPRTVAWTNLRDGERASYFPSSNGPFTITSATCDAPRD